jgi:hypothetical protein
LLGGELRQNILPNNYMTILFKSDYSHPEGIAQTDEEIKQLFASQSEQRTGSDYISEYVEDNVKSLSDATITKIADKVSALLQKDAASGGDDK